MNKLNRYVLGLILVLIVLYAVFRINNGLPPLYGTWLWSIAVGSPYWWTLPGPWIDGSSGPWVLYVVIASAVAAVVSQCLTEPIIPHPVDKSPLVFLIGLALCATPMLLFPIHNVFVFFGVILLLISSVGNFVSLFRKLSNKSQYDSLGVTQMMKGIFALSLLIVFYDLFSLTLFIS